jgi:hypothetical protein
MLATPRFLTFQNVFAPDLPAPDHETKGFGKGRDDLKFASVVLNN